MENWFAGAIGRGMNPDGAYGFQCKDVADDYCIHLFGDWISTIRPGNAKDAYFNASPDYFDKVRNTPDGVPPRGAILCFNGNMGGGFGHIGVVTRADVNSFDMVEQNGFTNTRPAYGAHYGNYDNVIGWLIPHIPEFAPAPAPLPPPPAPEPVQAPNTPDPPPAPIEPTKPTTEIILPVERDIEEVNTIKRIISRIDGAVRKLIAWLGGNRKFMAACVSAYGLYKTGQYQAAVTVVVAYFGANVWEKKSV